MPTVLPHDSTAGQLRHMLARVTRPDYAALRANGPNSFDECLHIFLQRFLYRFAENAFRKSADAFCSASFAFGTTAPMPKNSCVTPT